jgi:hypothetical protein
MQARWGRKPLAEWEPALFPGARHSYFPHCPARSEQMETNTNPVKEVFGELFTLLERLETQSAAVLQFVKDQGTITDEKLAPYLESAGNSCSVKWRAARLRMEYLLSPTENKTEDKKTEKPEPEMAPDEKQSAEKEAAKSGEAETEKGLKSESANGEQKDPKKQESKQH